MTKISVIMPVYNAELYLQKALSTVLYQSYDNLEIICINDGSCDNSLKILEEYKSKDKRIIVKSTGNSGAAAARNYGLSLASGEYVSFIDADDYVNLTLYNTFVKSVSKMPVDIWLFNMGFLYDETPFVIPKTAMQIIDWKNWTSEDSILTYDDCKNPFGIGISVANKIYSKKFLDENGLRFLEGSIFEDLLFNFDALMTAKSMKINFDTFYWYNQSNPASVTKMYKEKAFNIFSILNKIRAKLETQNLIEDYKYALLQFQYDTLFNIYLKTDERLRECFYKNMSDMLGYFKTLNFNPNICIRLKNYDNYNVFMKTKSSEEFFNYLYAKSRG